MIKKIIENIKDSFKKYLSNHIGTNIILALIAFAILIRDLKNPSESFIRFITTLFLTAMFALLGESYTKENKKRCIFYSVGLLISIFASKGILDEELSRYFLGVVYSVGFAILYVMAKNSKMTSNEYLTSTVTNVFKLGIIGSILNIGIMSIFGLISALLFDISYIFFIKLEFILFVIYYIPALIVSLETKEKENKFIYSVVNYVALPLITIATGVIYMYIIKLLFTMKLPHTATFAINAVLLIVGIVIVLMALSYKTETIMTKIASLLKKLFIPLVVLQIFSLSLRIYHYGITASRYFGIILLILGIVSMVLLNKNNGKDFKNILIYCIVISIVALMIPYFNIFDYPNYMQIKRLEKILPDSESYYSLTKKEKETVDSIFYYVSDEKYYPDYLSRDELKDMIYNDNEYYDDEDDYDDDYEDEENFIEYSNKKTRIDMNGYKAIEIDEFTNDDIESFTIEINNKEYNLEPFMQRIDSYNSEHNDVERYIENNNIISLDETMDLFITDLDLDYSDKYMDLSGYILYK